MPAIAVIDQDETLLELLSEVLEGEGWAVRTFSSDEAGDLVPVHPPDVIIIDPWRQTPDAGWPMLQALYDHPALNSARFIVWTTNPRDLGSRGAWLDERGIQLLPKPCDLGELLAAIESAPSRCGRA